MRYRFVMDNDGHWYIIPAEKLAEFNIWLEVSLNEEEWTGTDFDDDRIGCSPNNFTFENPLQDKRSGNDKSRTSN